MINEIQQELQQHLEILDAFYSHLIKQKDFLEHDDYDNLFSVESGISQLNDKLKQKREILSGIENLWEQSGQSISTQTQIQITDLLSQLTELTNKVLDVETKCNDSIETSKQKIGEKLDGFCLNENKNHMIRRHIHCTMN